MFYSRSAVYMVIPNTLAHADSDSVLYEILRIKNEIENKSKKAAIMTG